MKFALIATGTRGDVQPFVALGLGLKAVGMEVKIVTHAVFEEFVTSYGLGFYPLPGNVGAVLGGAKMVEVAKRGGKAKDFLQLLSEHITPLTEQILRAIGEAVQTADCLIASNWNLYHAHYHAVYFNKPLIMASVNPTGATRQFQNYLFKPAPWWIPIGRKFLNRLSHRFIEENYFKSQLPIWQKAWQNIYGASLPEKYGKAAFNQRSSLMLYGYSPSILPKPNDWEPHQQPTGYWFLPSAGSVPIPDGLETFLNASPKPLYIGFGSMNAAFEKQNLKMAYEALKKTGQRAIMLGSAANAPQAPDLEEYIFILKSVPFEWLFPQTAGVIHHGGAGTTALGLRSGVPNFIVPFIYDHRFWGDRVEAAGIGPKPIAINQLTADKLAAAIRQVMGNQKMQQKAAQMGEKICDEDGVQTAVKAIFQHLGLD